MKGPKESMIPRLAMELSGCEADIRGNHTDGHTQKTVQGQPDETG